MSCPCRDCYDRRIGCHSTCEKYIKWSEKKKAQKRERERDNDYIDYIRTFREKMKSRK
jgi:hypothetical protein